MSAPVKLQTSRRRTRTYDRQPLNLEEVIDSTQAQIESKADRVHGHVVNDISDATDTGKALVRAADPATGRFVLDVASTAELDQRDTENRDRSNHVGTQLAETISDLADAVNGLSSYTHNQITPSAVWTIPHGMQFNPTVSITDTAGGTWEGLEDHSTPGILTITFSAAFAGTARLT